MVRRRRRSAPGLQSARPDRLRHPSSLQCYVGTMKVGITCYPTYGGSGIVATELGLELATRGHEVHFITYSNPIRLDPGIPRIHYHEVEVSNYPLFQYPPYCLALASRMMDVAEAYDLDLLHVHYAIPHSISAMLAQQMMAPKRRLPFITTLHGTDITLVGADPSYFPITKFSIEKSDGVTSISEDLRKHTVEVFGVSNEIRVITNFINCDLYHPDPEKAGAAAYAPQGEKLLIHVSNFRPVKRVLDCIRILHEVRKHTPAHLLMRSEEHTSELQSPVHLACRLLLEKKKKKKNTKHKQRSHEYTTE